MNINPIPAAILLRLVLTLLLPCQAYGQLFQPDSAIASSFFSDSFDIGNVIDGSGLIPDFDPTDHHADYEADNHWTTEANQVVGVTATFFFDEDVTIGSFYLWNHRSNNIAANPFYEVTNFDLILLDADDVSLLTVEDLTAVGDTDVAQAYSFAPVSGVRSVQFIVNENQGVLQQIDPNYTGLAEVAFSSDDPFVLLGDVNLDGIVNLLDVAPFIDVLSSGDFQAEADINGDGVVDLLDVGPFVAILSGG